MAGNEAVLTTGFSEWLANLIAKERGLSIAFGDGAHVSDGNGGFNVTNPKKDATSLLREFARVPAYCSVSGTVVEGRASIRPEDMPRNVVSEAGLFDKDGRLIVVKSFAPKFTAPGDTEGYTAMLKIPC